MLQCQIISHFCSKCCLVLCPFRVQSLGKYTSLPWWYVRGCWSQKRAVYNCVFVDFFNVNKPSSGAFKIEPFVRRLRGVRQLSWDQMKCCSSKKVNHVLKSFSFKASNRTLWIAWRFFVPPSVHQNHTIRIRFANPQPPKTPHVTWRARTSNSQGHIEWFVYFSWAAAPPFQQK